MTAFFPCSILRYAAFLMLFLGVISNGRGEDIPAWLDARPDQPRTSVDPGKEVWLVISTSEDRSRPMDSLELLAVPAFVESGRNRRFLYDLTITLEKDGHTFQFDRNDIAYIRFYTRVRFSPSGAPTYYSYRPRFYLHNGHIIRQPPDQITPAAALNPDRFRYPKTEVTELYGKRQKRQTVTPLLHPVLALAWRRQDAEKARRTMREAFIEQEMQRAHLDWGETKRIVTPQGETEVTAHVRYEVTDEGSYSNWYEKTQGIISLVIDGRTHTFDFKDRCFDTVKRYQFENRTFCGSQVRVSLWRDDPSGQFRKLYFGGQGVDVFFDVTDREADVENIDLRTVNVGFELRVH